MGKNALAFLIIIGSLFSAESSPPIDADPVSTMAVVVDLAPASVISLGEQKGGIAPFCLWTTSEWPTTYSTYKIAEGRRDCGLFSGEAFKRVVIFDFTISGIPDTVFITNLVLFIDVDSTRSNTGSSPRIMAHDMLLETTRPAGRLLQSSNLTDALGNVWPLTDATYFDEPWTISGTGERSITLNSIAVEHFQNQLSADWFAIGLCIDGLIGANDTNRVILDPNRTRHYLRVTYAPPVNVTVRNDFSGSYVSVDDTLRPSPYSTRWRAGETHWISTDSLHFPVPGYQYQFRYWSDGGARRHRVTASSSVTMYRAYFDTLYRLLLECPYGNPRPIHGDSIWFSPRVWTEIDVTPCTVYTGPGLRTRHIFKGWQGIGSGSYTGPQHFANVQMNQPITQIAIWDTAYWLELEYTGCDTGVPAQIGEGWVNVRDSVWVITQDSIRVAGAWYFFRYWTGGAGHLRDSTRARTWYVNPIMARTITAVYTVNYALRVHPESLIVAAPGTYLLIPAILSSSVPFPVDSFRFRMRFNNSKLTFNSLINSRIIWSRLTATPGTGSVTVFGDAPGSTMFINPGDTLFYFYMQATYSAFGEDTIKFDNFQYAFSSALTRNGIVRFIPVDVNVIVTTNYGGDSVWVDGVPYPAPFFATWLGGSAHIIGVDSLNPLGTGEMARFVRWSDLGARFHTVNAISDTTFTAIFDTLLYLNVVSPYGTTSGSGWFARGSTPSFSVAPAIITEGLSRNVFAGWIGVGSGSYTGTLNPATCTMNSPITETAQWQRQYWLELDYTGTGGLVPTLTGEGWHNSGAWVPITADSVVGTSPRYYFAWWEGGTVADRFSRNTTAYIDSPDTIIAVYSNVPFGFALDIPETTTIPRSTIFNIPVRLNIPASTHIREISFHFRFNRDNANFTSALLGSLPWSSLNATDLSSGSVGHIYIHASNPTLLPIDPGDTLCVLRFLSTSTAMGIDTVICNDPGFDITIARPDSGLFIFPSPISVTITTSPMPMVVIVDGVPRSAPYSTIWFSRDPHNIGVDSIQYPSPGVQALWTSWSDLGARFHSVSPARDTTFIANFNIRYRLDVISAHGTTTGSGWFPAGTIAPFSVSPESVHVGNRYHLFRGWIGAGDSAYTGRLNPANARIFSPCTETARWENHYRLTLDYSGTPVAPILTGDGWFIEGAVAPISASDSVWSGTAWFYFLFWDGDGDIVDRYLPRTSVNMNYPTNLTAVYGSAHYPFFFGPPYAISSAGDAFCHVPIIFRGSPILADSIGFSIAFDSTRARLSSISPVGIPWSSYSITGAEGDRVVRAFSALPFSISDGDTLLSLIFYVRATSGSVPLDLHSPMFDLSGGLAMDGRIDITPFISVVVRTDFPGGHVNVDASWEVSPFRGEWTSGTEHQIGALSSEPFAPRHNKMFDYWSDSKPRNHYVSPITDTGFVAYFRDNYRFDVVSAYGFPVGSGWFDAGSRATFSVSPETVTVGGTRYIFNGWLGTGAGSYTGPLNPHNITISNPITETAQWRTRYFLSTSFVGCPGATPTIVGGGWFDAGTWAPISAQQIVSAPSGSPVYSFNHWTGGVFADSTNPATMICMDAPRSAVAVYADRSIDADDSIWVAVAETASIGIYANSASPANLDTIEFSLTFGGGILSFARLDLCGIAWDYTNATTVHLGGGVIRIDVRAYRRTPYSIDGSVRLLCVKMRANAGGVAPFNLIVNRVRPEIFPAINADRAIIVNPTARITLASPIADSLVFDYRTYPAGTIIIVPINSYHIAEAPELADIGVDLRYRFANWHDTPDRIREIRPRADTTITANYFPQFLVRVHSAHGTTSGGGWFDFSSLAVCSVSPNEITIGDSIIYRFNRWSGDYTGRSNPCTLVVDAPKTITARWDTLYRVTVESPYGTAGTSGWVRRGDSTILKIRPTIIDLGSTKHIFASWTGTGIGSYSGPSDSLWIYPQSPIREVANWNTGHRVIISNGGRGTVVGGGWYDHGDTACFLIFTPFVDSITGIRHSFAGWLGAGDSSYTGSAMSVCCRVLSPITETAQWVRQNYLTVNNGGHSTATGAGWYNHRAIATFSVNPDTVVVAPGVQWRFSGWTGSGVGSYSGPSNPATVRMDNPYTETANWERKFYLSIVDSGAGGIPTFSGIGWHTPRTWANISAPPVVISGSARYTFIRWSGGTFENHLSATTRVMMDTTRTITAHYADYDVSPPETMLVSPGETLVVPVILHYPYLRPIMTIQLDVYYPDSLLRFIRADEVPTLDWTTFISYLISPGRATVYGNRSMIWIMPPETLLVFKFLPRVAYARSDTIRFGDFHYDISTANTRAGRFFIQAPITVVIRSDYGGPDNIVIVDGMQFPSPYTGSWISGQRHQIGAKEHYTVGNTRAIWSNWSDGGALYHDIFPARSDTFTAFYRTQHKLTIVAPHGTSSGAGWFNEGDSATFSLTPDTITDGGARYIFTSWTGTGSGSYTGTNNPARCRMNGPITETANYNTQYYLTVNGVHSPTTGSGWYNSGALATFSVTNTIIYTAPDARWVFDRWAGAYAGTSNPAVWTVTSANTQTAQWRREYLLTIISERGTPIGAGWFREGEVVSFSINSVIDSTAGIRWHFDRWTSTAGGYSGTNNPATITMTRPITQTAHWRLEYLLSVNSHRGTVSGGGWYPAGDSATFAVVPETVAVGSTRHIFSRWVGTGAGSYTGGNNPHRIRMDSPITETAQWDVQHLLVVNGGPSATTGSGWYDFGANATFSVTSPVMESFGMRFSFVRWSGLGAGSYSGTGNPSACTMLGPIIENAIFDTTFSVQVVSAHGTTHGSGYYQRTTPVFFDVVPESIEFGGTRYRFARWNGVGPGSYTGTNNPAIAHPESAIVETAKWDTLFDLRLMAIGCGSATPILTGGGFRLKGWNAISAQNPIYDGERRYHFKVWRGGIFEDSLASATRMNLQSPDTAIAIYSAFEVSPPESMFARIGDTAWVPIILYNSSPLLADSIGFILNFNTTMLSYHGVREDLGVDWASVSVTPVAGGIRLVATNPTPIAIAPAETLIKIGLIVSSAGPSISEIAVRNRVLDLANSGTIDGVLLRLNAIAVTVRNEFDLDSVIVDGVKRASPFNTNWVPGSIHTIEAKTQIPISAGIRERWDSWSDGGEIAHSVRAYSETTFTANFIRQYRFGVFNSGGDSPTPPVGSHWFDEGSLVVAFVQNPDPITHQSCAGFFGTGDLPATGTADSISFRITQPTTIYWRWVPQVPLYVRSLFGSPYPVRDTTWHAPGEWIYAFVDSFVLLSPDSGALCVSHTGTGSARSGYGHRTSFAINTPSSLVWDWQIAYRLSVSADGCGAGYPEVLDGEGYYISGTRAEIVASRSVTHAGITYFFDRWQSVPAGAVFADPTDTLTTVTVNAPMSAIAKYKRGVLLQLVKSPMENFGGFFVGGVPFLNIGHLQKWLPECWTGTIATTAQDTSADRDSLYVFTSWSDGGAISHTIGPVCSDRTITANMQKRYRLRILKNPYSNIYGTTTVDGSIYTGAESRDLSLYFAIGTTHTVSVSEFDNDAPDKRFAWQHWDDFAPRTRTVGPISAPMTLNATYGRQYLITAMKTPTHTAGWIKFESTTTPGVSSLGRWYNSGATANIEVSTPDGNIDTLWTFTRWTGGGTSPAFSHSPVDTPRTFTAEYNREIVVISFAVDTASWRIGPISISETRTMVASEVITITNTGTYSVMLGLKVTDPAGWMPGYSAGEDRFALKARFDDSAIPPAVWSLIYDAVTDAVQWASATRFGPGGFNIGAGTTEKLWFKLQAPTRTSLPGAHNIKATLYGQLYMP